MAIPKFIINKEEYVSLYDLRNFLGEDDKNGSNLKYQLRKKFQNLERNQPNERLVIEQKEILKKMDPKHKIHINPNKKNVFLKINQIEFGEFSYLSEFKLPIDNSFIINLDTDNPIKTCNPPIFVRNGQSTPSLSSSNNQISLESKDNTSSDGNIQCLNTKSLPNIELRKDPIVNRTIINNKTQNNQKRTPNNSNNNNFESQSTGDLFIYFINNIQSSGKGNISSKSKENYGSPVLSLQNNHHIHTNDHHIEDNCALNLINISKSAKIFNQK